MKNGQHAVNVLRGAWCATLMNRLGKDSSHHSEMSKTNNNTHLLDQAPFFIVTQLVQGYWDNHPAEGNLMYRHWTWNPCN